MKSISLIGKFDFFDENLSKIVFMLLEMNFLLPPS